MKAVLVMRECILKGTGGELCAQGKREGLQALADAGLFTILLDPSPDAVPGSAGSASRLAGAIEAAGGRIDAVIWCPHAAGDSCGCWNTYPGLIRSATERFDLQPNECYLIAYTLRDLEMAVAAGVRPILYLDGRSVADVQGDRCPHKDHPIARTLAQAVAYMRAEEETSAKLGRPRLNAAPTLVEEMSRPGTGAPAVAALSPEALAYTRRLRLRPRPRELARWLGLLIVGGVWLSLGIAYLLAHLYRVQPFPEVVWYITLQFMPRVARGVLFVLTGIAVVLLASRSFIHTFGNGVANGARGGRPPAK